MINFIPIEYYTTVYYNIILIFVIITWFHSISVTGFTKETGLFNKYATIILIVFLLFFMGFRPISYIFVDMGTYASVYDQYVNGNENNISTDYGFNLLIRILAYFNSKVLFFFIISVLYIFPLYIASKRWFPNYYYFSILILVASFSFWSYGTNGLRNGLATSFTILAFSYINKKWLMYILFLVAYSFHSSVLLPIFAYFLTSVFRFKFFYFGLWVLSIFFSLTLAEFWENFFLRFGFGKEDKLQGYFSNKELFKDTFAYTGFRWDFLIYSSVVVLIAFYFIEVKKFKDKQYIQLTNIYLLTNAFWILVIRANFSNRFAYLSWFMMGIVIIYPFLKQLYWKNQFSIIGVITILYYSFTYIINVIL